MGNKRKSKPESLKYLAIFKGIWCCVGTTFVFISILALSITTKIADSFPGIDFSSVVAHSGPWYMKAAYFLSDNMNLTLLFGIWCGVIIICYIYEFYVEKREGIEK